MISVVGKCKPAMCQARHTVSMRILTGQQAFASPLLKDTGEPTL
jgi:hypothetical protein